MNIKRIAYRHVVYNDKPVYKYSPPADLSTALFVGFVLFIFLLFVITR